MTCVCVCMSVCVFVCVFVCVLLCVCVCVYPAFLTFCGKSLPSFVERGLYHSRERGCCHFDWLQEAESLGEGERDRGTERQKDREIER